MTRCPLAIAAALALAGAAAAPAESAPRFDQLVVFRDGDAEERHGRHRAHVRTRAGDHRCRVPKATPLAALVRSEVAELGILDFSGSCDPASLFVSRIGPNKNRGQSGWVYKVGNRQGTTGAADPSGALRQRAADAPRPGHMVLLRLRGRRLPAHTRPARARDGRRTREGASDGLRRRGPRSSARGRAGPVGRPVTPRPTRTGSRRSACRRAATGYTRRSSGYVRSFDERVRVE